MAAARPEVDKTQLDELRASLQNVTGRYAEIGELKKNHLVLRDMIESLQQTTEGFRNESFAGNSAKIGELEKEVLALRAEVRRAYQRVENLEATGLQVKRPSSGPDPLKEISSLREELANAGKIRAAEHDRIQSEVGALQGRVNETLQTLTALPGKLESFCSQIRHLDQQYQPLKEGLAAVSGAIDGTPQKIADLTLDLTTLREGFSQLQERVQAMQEGLDSRASSPAGPGVPGQTDMTLIRDNLDEIRRFIITLSQKIR
jgi:chromosome segregation ATPase